MEDRWDSDIRVECGDSLIIIGRKEGRRLIEVK